MRRQRTLAAFLLGFAILAGPATMPASAGPLQTLRAAHERHMRELRAAHQRHVRFVQRAHARHMKYAPAPVRKVDRAIMQRHNSHRRAVERTVQTRHAAHVRAIDRTDREVRASLSNSVGEPVRLVESRHAAHQRSLGSVGASVDRDVQRAHQRHLSWLERFTDWLVG